MMVSIDFSSDFFASYMFKYLNLFIPTIVGDIDFKN